MNNTAQRIFVVEQATNKYYELGTYQIAVAQSSYQYFESDFCNHKI